MAVHAISGFETGLIEAEAISDVLGNTAWAKTGAPTLDTTIVRTGTYSLKISPPSATTQYIDSNNSAAPCRFYVRFTVLPTTNPRTFIGQSTGAGLAGLQIRSDGKINWILNGVVTYTSTVALTDTTRWYMIEVRSQANAVIVRVDGVDEITRVGAAQGVRTMRIGCDDTVADTYTAYFDDIMYRTVDTDWPIGPGRGVMLLPVSDNTVTNWVRGAGSTTTGLFNPVSTRPPPGVASASETDNTNIESSSSSGTATYSANMTTYLAAGVGNGAVVNAIVPIMRHGEDISTGTKTVTMELTANPVVGSVSVSAGLDAGAHAAEVNLWKTRGVTTATPTVTVETTPVMKLVKTDTTTRTACVDFMGIYVDYTPRSFVYSRRNRSRIIR